MKKLSVVLLALLSCPLRSHADLQAGSQTLNPFGGGFVYHDHYSGAQYAYYLGGSPLLGVGLDVSYLPQYIGSDSQTWVMVPYVKITNSAGKWRPFLLGGFGAHHTQVRYEDGPWGPLNPSSGVWPDTGTSEHRTIADGSGMSWAAVLGAGMDVHFNDRFFMGAELRNTMLGPAHISTNANGAQTHGSEKSTGLLFRMDLLWRVGVKWGKS